MTLILSSKKTYIIAEVGVNHNGKISIAKKLIHQAKKAGADAVKFQIYDSNLLVTSDAKQAPYQKKNMKIEESQIKMLKRYEFDRKKYYLLKKFCKEKKIDFMVSAFDESGVEFIMNKLKSNVIKIPSGEINNVLLLKRLNTSNINVLISTGMSNYSEIIEAINTIAKKKVYKLINNKPKIVNYSTYKKIKKKICILHCVTDYPVDDQYANLNCINNMIKDFNLYIGYSDHTLGIIASVIASNKGARVIEKHFTLNKKMIGPDHLASLEPKEFKNMVKKIRQVELMQGDGIKKIQKCEIRNAKVARKSVVAKIPIKKNDKFTFDNLTLKRPGTGLNPFMIYKLINKKSKKNYKTDELIKL